MPHIAQYSTSHVPSFAVGNPYSEAIPPLPEHQDLTLALFRKPQGNFGGREMPTSLRFMEISSLLDIHLPRPECNLLAVRCLSMLHNAYRRNHPFAKETLQKLFSIDGEAFNRAAATPLQVDASSVLGWSGMGKTTMIRSVLELFPQVIHHERYEGKEFFQRQVVYLSVDAPVAASAKGLILSIAAAIDKALGLSGPGSYANQFAGSHESVDKQRVLITRTLATHGVGILHIDDLQRLSEGSKTQRTAVSAMIIGIANLAGCALLFSGTFDALAVLQSNFEIARRANRRGSVLLKPPADGDLSFFLPLVNFLFQHQLVDKPVAPTEKLCQHLLRLTAGIPGVMTMLYTATQETALALGKPLTAELFSSVMRDQFGILQAPIRKLNTMRKRGVLQWDADTDRAIAERLSGAMPESTPASSMETA